MQDLIIFIGAVHAFKCPLTITPESRLGPDGLGLNSIEIGAMAVALEGKYGVEIPDEDCRKWETVQDVHDYLKARGDE